MPRRSKSPAAKSKTKQTEASPVNVLVLGGASGCVSNIIVDRLCTKPGKFTVIVAGRTPMAPRDDLVPKFIPYNIFGNGALKGLLESLKDYGDVHAVVNCICTGGKTSYDTTQVAYLNYVAMSVMVELCKALKAKLVHMSSLKVGSPESFDWTSIEQGPAPWTGPRSPYAWSKLAAELKLLNSDLPDMSFIRIGLMDSPHGKKFYTRVRMITDFNVKVTTEEDLQDAIELAIGATGRYTTCVMHHIETNVNFQYRMSGGRWLVLYVPYFLFNFFFAHLLPTKLLDYTDPNSTFDYKLPL
jgi:dTDP-4-dehydrorhamnose reductase